MPEMCACSRMTRTHAHTHASTQHIRSTHRMGSSCTLVMDGSDSGAPANFLECSSQSDVSRPVQGKPILVLRVGSRQKATLALTGNRNYYWKAHGSSRRARVRGIARQKMCAFVTWSNWIVSDRRVYWPLSMFCRRKSRTWQIGLENLKKTGPLVLVCATSRRRGRLSSTLSHRRRRLSHRYHPLMSRPLHPPRRWMTRVLTEKSGKSTIWRRKNDRERSRKLRAEGITHLPWTVRPLLYTHYNQRATLMLVLRCGPTPAPFQMTSPDSSKFVDDKTKESPRQLCQVHPLGLLRWRAQDAFAAKLTISLESI